MIKFRYPECSDQELQRKAQFITDGFAIKANTIFNTKILIPVKLTFDLADTSPSSAGMASMIKSKTAERVTMFTLKIQLNMFLLRENPVHLFNETIPHEIGHLVIYELFFHRLVSVKQKIHSHGVEWNEVVKKLGRKPLKHHSLNVTSSLKHFKSLKIND